MSACERSTFQTKLTRNWCRLHARTYRLSDRGKSNHVLQCLAREIAASTDIILIVGHEWHGAQVGCICALRCSGILITFQQDDQAFLVETDEILTFNLIFVNSEQNVFVDAPRICGAVEKEQTQFLQLRVLPERFFPVTSHFSSWHESSNSNRRLGIGDW